VLTKAVSSQVFHTSLDKLGMNDIYTPIWEGVLTLC
jgi:hypothetical protein